MSSVRNWAVGSVIAALILLSPVVAFLIVIIAELVIDFAMEAGTAVDCTIAAGAIGWALFRKRSAHLVLAPRSGPEEDPDEAAIAAPPM
jgi:hypothetical protein